MKANPSQSLINMSNFELVFTSALWYYMTPKYPMPSAHAVMTGIFKPNEVDKRTGADNNFGSTIAIFD